MKTTLQVVVVYENAETREAAVNFCDRLVERFWSNLEFDVSWWHYPLLSDPTAGNEALQRAATADVLVFAPQSDSPMTDAMQEWAESWVRLRGQREGVLVGLPPQPEGEPELPAKAHRYLRGLAHRTGMDYLTGVPQNLSRWMPDETDFWSKRAEQVTQVLDDILRPPPPPHLP